jgi:hypothetical protein
MFPSAVFIPMRAYQTIPLRLIKSDAKVALRKETKRIKIYRA